MEWKYKIDIADEKVFDEYEAEFGIKFSSEIKEFVLKHNAASPSDDCIMVNGVERVFESVLSFNKNEDDATTFIDIFEPIRDLNVIPFALDPFGNVFCCLMDTGVIVFYNHEEKTLDTTNITISTLESNLYSGN